MTTSEKLADLLVQATTEKSHYYVASVCREAIDEIRLLRWKLGQFKCCGTDGCRTCETGRVSLFVANERCRECAPETYKHPTGTPAGNQEEVE